MTRRGDLVEPREIDDVGNLDLATYVGDYVSTNT